MDLKNVFLHVIDSRACWSGSSALHTTNIGWIIDLAGLIWACVFLSDMKPCFNLCKLSFCIKTKRIIFWACVTRRILQERNHSNWHQCIYIIFKENFRVPLTMPCRLSYMFTKTFFFKTKLHKCLHKSIHHITLWIADSSQDIYRNLVLTKKISTRIFWAVQQNSCKSILFIRFGWKLFLFCVFTVVLSKWLLYNFVLFCTSFLSGSCAREHLTRVSNSDRSDQITETTYLSIFL